jgi:hypothetical protein
MAVGLDFFELPTKATVVLVPLYLLTGGTPILPLLGYMWFMFCFSFVYLNATK